MRTFVLINQKKLKEPKPRKCKNPDCKNTFVPTFSSLQVVCSIKCSQELAHIKEREKAIKEDKKIIAEMKIDTHSKEFKRELQNEINKLARMIDAYFGLDTCICCDKPMRKQIHGAHLASVGSNSSLRFCIHNIHSATSQCNKYNPSHESGYKLGLAKRYGDKYANYVINELPLLYKEIKLSNREIHEKLKLVRSLIKNFNTFDLQNPINARNLFNDLIGIYKTNF